MVKGTKSESVFSFTTTRGHTTHISILWVFVLFTFLCVAVVLLAGYQDGLKERDFPGTKVNGDLEVTGNTVNPTGEVGRNSFDNVTNAANFTASYNTTHMLAVAPGAALVITLPSPNTKAGTVIKFIVTIPVDDGSSWAITSPNALSTSSYLISSAGTPITFDPAGTTASLTGGGSSLVSSVANGTDTTLTISGATAGGGGAGSTVVCTSTGSAWILEARLTLQGGGTAADTSTFS